MYLSCHTLYTLMNQFAFYVYAILSSLRSSSSMTCGSLHSSCIPTYYSRKLGEGEGRPFIPRGVAYWGQGCFLLTWVIWGNTNLYGITKRTYTYMTVHSCLILILPNKLHISGNIKSNWQSESGPDTMYFTVV